MTAVEFLIDKICGEHTEAWIEEIQQALEMEKQQIIDAYIEGYTTPEFSADATQYYYLTYKIDNP